MVLHVAGSCFVDTALWIVFKEFIQSCVFVCLDVLYFLILYISIVLKGGTILGSPDEVVPLGDTEITQELFMEFLRGLGMQEFR